MPCLKEVGSASVVVSSSTPVGGAQAGACATVVHARTDGGAKLVFHNDALYRPSCGAGHACEAGVRRGAVHQQADGGGEGCGGEVAARAARVRGRVGVQGGVRVRVWSRVKVRSGGRVRVR